MGLISPDLPDLDYPEWRRRPRGERLQTLTRHWVEHGFGTPGGVYLLYALKCALYVLGAAFVISLTPGIGGVGDVADWWTEPIVYQKLVVYTLLGPFLCGQLDRRVAAAGHQESLRVAVP